jgi:uncharacterized phage protein gp47/JayE
VSFAAEPYGVFVDDLLTNLTGGVSRERFVFLPENEPFRLEAGLDVVPETLRIRGIANESFHRFSPLTDFQLVDGVVTWRADTDGARLASATWPDRGTPFWASYERTPDPQSAPSLTDRNPGSITRTLAESFAREYAVLSMQLDAVHKAAFVETATGRDLDAVAALVGIERRGRTFAGGEVIFSRTSPAPGDIFIPAGTRISTADVPAVTVETTAERRLQAGGHSAAVPVSALVEGPEGIAPPGTLTVLHRPILGITSVTNAEVLSFGPPETDEALRRRAALALQAAGRGTQDAIVGALTAVEGIREQDVLLTEDHLGFPGVVKVTIAAELDEERARRAVELIESERPAGVRFLHNLPVAALAVSDPGPGGGGGGDPEGGDPGAGTPPPVTINENRYPIAASVAITPSKADLTAAQKQELVATASEVLDAAVERAGVGEPVIYNRVVAELMAIEGVYDVVVDLYEVGGTPPGKHNLRPRPSDTRAQLVEKDVTLRGALIALDVTVEIELIGIAVTSDPDTEADQARDDINAKLSIGLSTLPTIEPGTLLTLLPATDRYRVDSLSYQAEFVDEGLRVQLPDISITPHGDQQAWLRSLTVRQQTIAGDGG